MTFKISTKFSGHRPGPGLASMVKKGKTRLSNRWVIVWGPDGYGLVFEVRFRRVTFELRR